MPVYLLRKTVNKTEFQVKGNIANVDLSRWEEEILEADLICQIPCDMGPFTEGKIGTLFMNFRILRHPPIQKFSRFKSHSNFGCGLVILI